MSPVPPEKRNGLPHPEQILRDPSNTTQIVGTSLVSMSSIVEGSGLSTPWGVFIE